MSNSCKEASTGVRSSFRGAVLVEYILALGVLLGVFVMGGIILQRAAEDRAKEAAKTERSMVPCQSGGALESYGGAYACR